MRHLALLALFLFACPSFAQESILDRLARIESNNNAIMATQARLQSDVTDLKDDVRLIKDKLDALAKVVAPNATFNVSTKDEWGRGNAATFGGASSPAQSMYSSSNYSSQSMTSQRRGLFSGRLLSAPLFSGKLLVGKCASGN